MLEKRDIEIIAGLIDSRAAKTEEKFAEMDKRFTEMDEKFSGKLAEMDEKFSGKLAEMEERILRKVDEKIDASEEFLLDEMDRYDKKYEKRFDGIDQKLDDLSTLYRLIKTENETIDYVVKITDQHEERITRLERLRA